MKTLTVKQPWASLIVEGIKDVENRTWKTNFRGRVLIHAGKAEFPENLSLILDYSQMLDIEEHKKAQAIYISVLPIGAIIGSVEIVDCLHKTYHSIRDTKSIWAEEGSWHWVLANPIKFPEPIPAKGKLSFWDYPNILAEPEEKDGELFCHCQLSVKEINQVTGDCRFGYYCRYCGGKWYK